MDRILIVDHSRKNGRILGKFFTQKGFEVKFVLSGNTAVSWMKNNRVDIVILSFKLPDDSGLDLLQKLRIIDPEIQVILTAEYSDVKVAVSALKKGAFDYVTHPLYPDEMLAIVEKALEKKNGENTVADARKKIKKKSERKKFIYGSSPQAQILKNQIELIAPTDFTVIITGETGTGKEFVAREIRQKSPRRSKPFVALDCGAIPEQLASSELFGHVKGAYTGAISDKKGCFERANGGVLFLDEVGNLSYENQMNLLRVLQERVINRVGDVKTIPVDVRIIVATNEDLKEAVVDGDFREDLFHRLNEFTLQLPPLRERKEDIEEFSIYFLQLANKKLDKSIKGFERQTLEKLKSYYWHGNLRELNNLIKRAALITSEPLVQPSSLPPEIMMDMTIYGEEGTEDLSLKSVRRNAEIRAIRKALKKSANNKTKAARLLGIDRKSLYNKLDEYQL